MAMDSIQTDKAQQAKNIQRVTAVCLAINIFLAIGKGIVGVLGHSQALVADALHSFYPFCLYQTRC